MSRSDMQRVYRLLKIAREQGTIPWHHIVDETRGIERIPSWDDPEDFADSVSEQYRRDFWKQQPARCEVWSEKGTVRGILKPVLDQYGVGFNPVHGFNSSIKPTKLHPILTAGRSLCSMSATGTLPACLCRNATCQRGMRNTTAITSLLSELR